MDVTSLAIGLAGGAAGNALGKSPITGEKPWNKVLAPAAAILLPMIYKKFVGGGMSDEQVIEAGFAIGTTAVGLYSGGKNLYQFVRGLLKKGA